MTLSKATSKCYSHSFIFKKLEVVPHMLNCVAFDKTKCTLEKKNSYGSCTKSSQICVLAFDLLKLVECMMCEMHPNKIYV